MRGRPRFKEFSVVLVPVLVDSPGGAFSCLALDGPAGALDFMKTVDETERHAKALVKLMVEQFPEGATSTEFQKASGLAERTFMRALAWAKHARWFVGGGNRGVRYNLNPDGCWNSSLPPSLPHPAPYRGWQ